MDTRIRWALTGARRCVAVQMAALLAGAALIVASAAPAQAVARLSVSSSLGGAVASASGATTFTVSGSGFQALEGGFGGVYIGFGWVNGSNWGPSQGGATGRTYDYVPDDQSRNNQGYQAFVAFPGSETAGEAQGQMGKDGSFRVQMAVPGPEFTGAGGKRINCLEMTCGFFTWGAHGVRNGANETFTPVTFQTGAASADQADSPAETVAPAPAPSGRAASGRTEGAQGRAAAPRPAERAAVGTQGGAAPVESAEPGAPAASSGDAPAADAPATATGGTRFSTAGVIEVDRKSARAGGAMGFAAAGFWPGEQVYVVLGEGIAAVGPVLAGVDGEIAGVITLPEDLEAGTHEIRAAGAGSGIEAVERFPVRVDIAQTTSSAGLSASLSWVFLAIAALALLAAGAFVIRRRQSGAPSGDDGDPDPAWGDLVDTGGYAGPAHDGSGYPTAGHPTTLLKEEGKR